MIRVLVVASSPVVRAGLAAVLEHEGLVVVDASDGRDGALGDGAPPAVDVIVWATGPDVMSPVSPRVAGAPALVLLAPRRDAEWAARALVNGALAVLDPEPTAEEIVAAVEAAARGLVVLSPGLAATLAVRPPVTPGTDDGKAGPVMLTPRELEILGWLAQGLANKQVAARLGVSEHTVKTHVAHAFEKLGVGTRAEAVARAVRMGLLSL